jgi:hypothetical protein
LFDDWAVSDVAAAVSLVLVSEVVDEELEVELVLEVVTIGTWIAFATA